MISDQLRQSLPDLSTAQRVLATFLLEHPAEAAYLSSHDLAARTDTSPSTVVRLAQALGYSGFPSFQSELQKSLRDRLGATTRLYSTLAEGNELTARLRADVHALEQAMVDISPSLFEEIVTTLAQARRIYLVGFGISTAVVDTLAFRLRRLRLEVHPVTAGGSDLLEPLLAMTPGDVVVAVAFRRIRPELLTAMRFAKARGATTIAFAESPASDHAQMADRVLLTRRGPEHSLNSLVVPIAVANALSLGVSSMRVKEAALAYSWLDEYQRVTSGS